MVVDLSIPPGAPSGLTFTGSDAQCLVEDAESAKPVTLDTEPVKSAEPVAPVAAQ